MAKLKCVLLDAGPVIALHHAGIWKQFCERYDVVVSEIVADDEALWHSRDEVTGARTAISLRDAEAQGLISIEAATTENSKLPYGLQRCWVWMNDPIP